MRTDDSWSRGLRSYEEWRAQIDPATDRLGVTHSAVSGRLYMCRSAYNKRRRGEQTFSVPEAIALSDVLGIAPPAWPAGSGPRRAGESPPSASPVTDGEVAAYAAQVGRFVRTVAHAAEVAGEPVDAWVSASDLPLLHLLAEPSLWAFKLYLFAGVSEEGFAWPRLDDALAGAGSSTGSYPPPRLDDVVWGGDREIWHERPLASLLGQLHHVARKGVLGAVGADVLHAGLRRLVDRLEARLRSTGGPGEPPPLELYVDRCRGCSPRYVVAVRERYWAVRTLDLVEFEVYDDSPSCERARRAFDRRLPMSRRVCDREGLPIGTFVREMRADVEECFARLETRG